MPTSWPAEFEHLSDLTPEAHGISVRTRREVRSHEGDKFLIMIRSPVDDEVLDVPPIRDTISR